MGENFLHSCGATALEKDEIAGEEEIVKVCSAGRVIGKVSNCRRGTRGVTDAGGVRRTNSEDTTEAE